MLFCTNYSKTCLKRPLITRTKIGFLYQLSFNAVQKYCRMLQKEHSAILLTFIKLSFVFKTFVLFIFEWPLKTCFTVMSVLVCVDALYLHQQFFFDVKISTVQDSALE